jgi:HSP20 family protein
MALVRWEPWNELARLRREFGGLFADRSGAWMPAADVTREDDVVTLKLDLPGLGAGDVNIELRDQRLVIRGERKRESEEKVDGVVTRERVFGSFVRELALPAGVDADDVHATFSNGELTVKVTLPAEPEAKQIEIESGDHAVV